MCLLLGREFNGTRRSTVTLAIIHRILRIIISKGGYR